jgi:hypothetical protein
MKTITLYTGFHGYQLFNKGLSFIASQDRKSTNDYKVIAPIENIVEYQMEAEIGCYDVIKTDGVTVNFVEE